MRPMATSVASTALTAASYTPSCLPHGRGGSSHMSNGRGLFSFRRTEPFVRTYPFRSSNRPRSVASSYYFRVREQRVRVTLVGSGPLTGFGDGDGTQPSRPVTPFPLPVRNGNGFLSFGSGPRYRLGKERVRVRYGVGVPFTFPVPVPVRADVG
uniref:Putative phosphoglycerate mutase n=1 Tax=Ixodes ricinus TaxID=34613 RepID=A0A0K8R3D4_IXORI